MVIAACGSTTAAPSSTTTTLSLAILGRQYNHISAIAQAALTTYKNRAANLESVALATGRLPSQTQVTALFGPLIDAFSSAERQLEQLSVPTNTRSDLHSLIAAYAAVVGDFEEIEAVFPDAQTLEQQESTDIAKLDSAAAVFVADLDTNR